MEIKLTTIHSFFGKRILMMIMRTFIFLLCTTVFSLNSESSLAQEKVKIEIDKVLSVDEVFDMIVNQTKYRLIYPSDLFKDAPKVQLKKGVVSLGKLLQQTLPKGKFNVILGIDNRITIKEKSKRQQKQVSGEVVDEAGLPMPGVVVLVKGTTNGATTNFDGAYNITVSAPENVLVFSFLGYKTQEITVGNQSIINVTLQEDVAELSEVVVTGYQKISKERSAGSYAKAEIDKVANRSTSMSVLERLDGLVPGLTLNFSQDGLTSDGSSNDVTNNILIRGLSSINGEVAPLYVVDGIPLPDISSINPQDVEDITVLKDATAASIWGSRAANGVIVITTKRGGFNEKTSVNYNTFFSFQGKPDIDYLKNISSAQYIDLAKDVFDPVRFPYSRWSDYTQRRGALTPHAQILYDLDNGTIDQATADARLNTLASSDNKSQVEDLYRNATLNNHNFSVRGGGEKYAFFGSLAYTNTEQANPGNNSEVFKLNLSQDFKIGKRIDFRLNTDLTNNLSKRNRPLNPQLIRAIPYVLLKDGQGNHLNAPSLGLFSRDELSGYENTTGLDLSYTPLDEINRGYTNFNGLSARVNANVDIELLKNLTYQGAFGYFHQNGKTESFDAENAFNVRTDRILSAQNGTNPGDVIFNMPLAGGYLNATHNFSRNWTVRNQFTYDENWNDKHALTVVAGYEVQEQLFNAKSNFITGYDPQSLLAPALNYELLNGLIPDALIPIRFGRGEVNLPQPYQERETLLRVTSYYGTAGYTFNNKYSLNASVRADESNLFGIDKSAQGRPVWSAGAKWAIGKESFLENADFIDQLALRATFGITGNSPRAGISSSFDIFTISNPGFAGTFFPEANFLYNILTPGNEKLTWERTENLNLGLDFSLFNNRVRGSFDYYENKTEDLFDELPVNPISGFNTITGNAGNLENKGIELSLQTINLDGQFKWSTAFTLGHNKNKITKLVSEEQTPTSPSTRTFSSKPAVGYPAFPLFAYDFVGLNNEGSPEIRLNDGSIISTDIGGDLTLEDLKFMGTRQPVWSGGFSNTFSYKGFTLTANMIYNLGHVMLLDNPTDYDPSLLRQSSFNFIHPDFLNRWQQPGDEATTNIPAAFHELADQSIERSTNYYTYGDINVASASYIKLRDITLQYALPKTFLSKVNIQAMSLRMQVNNLLLWTKNNRGIDPEFHNGIWGSRSIPTQQGTITFGMNITL